MKLTTAQLDRAVGVLLGTAAGDALGAAYEFGPPRGPELEVAMVGGGSFGWEPGEWTDDTSMAIAIAEVAATGADLREERRSMPSFGGGTSGPNTPKTLACRPVGPQPRAGTASPRRQRAGESAALHERSGRTAGNGSLMRTAPVALAYLDDEAALVEAARAVSELTHSTPTPVTRACCGASPSATPSYRRARRSNRPAAHRRRAPRPVGHAAGCRRERHSLRTSPTTGGWSKPCRVRGARSRPRPSRRTIR